MTNCMLTIVVVLCMVLMVLPRWSVPVHVASVPSRRNVTHYLLDPERYDSTSRPNMDTDLPINVSVQIFIHNMYSLNEMDMEFSVEMFLQMWWRDERLDYSSVAPYELLEVDIKIQDSVWMPDLFFLNEKRASVHTVTSPNKLMHILRNGTVIYSIRLAMTLFCTMDLSNYPFDKQICPMILQSFGYTKENINLDWKYSDPFKVREVEMPQYNFLGDVTELLDYDSSYSGTGTFSTLKARLYLSRRLGRFFIQIFVPSSLLTTLSWVSFWVDASAVPARVSLGVTCVLSMVAQCVTVQRSLPPVSYVKAIDIWMFVCLFCVFAALLEFALVNVLMRRGEQTTEQETNIENGDETDETKLMIDDRSTTTQAPDSVAREENADENTKKVPKMKRSSRSCVPCIQCRYTCEDTRTKARTLDRLSRIVFPGTFMIFLLIFFLSVH